MTTRARRRTIAQATWVAIIEITLTGWGMMILLGMLAGWTGNHGIDVGFWPALAAAILLRLAIIPSHQHRER